MSSTQPAPRVREAADAILARNLVVARLLAGLTQQELAAASGISRATIAQLETGVSDPRLSTMVVLAQALRISPIILLAGQAEVEAIAKLPADLVDRPVNISAIAMSRMESLLRTGMLIDRSDAARCGAAVANEVGESGQGAVITAGIFSAFVPGGGTQAGISFGRLLEHC